MEHVKQLSLIEDTKPMIDISHIIEAINLLDEDGKIEAINEIKLQLHNASPLKGEPVDCVLWVKSDNVQANDYNPNSVAPPEMELLEVSILEDGYTQPIVTFSDEGHRTVVDGFHRNRVGKESKLVRERIRGYLPVVTINSDRTGKGDRIASTIRHNRARGKHKIDAMSEIIIDLKRRNWSNEKISRELGMDADEILRLAQITGLAEMFADTDFTEAWEAVDGLVIDETDTLETAE
jgi:ParB-like chromosome segregation protein Spo0J